MPERGISSPKRPDASGVGTDRPPKGPKRVTVISDVIENAVVEDGPYGARITREFLVDGLSGTETDTLIQALRARGIPYRGQYHPDFPVPCESVIARSVDGSPTKARVTANYAFPFVTGGLYDNDPSDTELPAIEVINNVRGVQRDKDREGNPIVAPYLDDEGQSKLSLKFVEYQEPMVIVRYHRRERGNPAQKAKAYVGKVNSTVVFGDPPRTWLCTGISGVSEDGGRSFNVAYEFQYNAQSWDVTVIHVDDEGHVQPGAEPRTYNLYAEADFWPLNLTTV